MNKDLLQGSLPSPDQLKDVCQTLSGLPAPSDQFAARLQFIADLLAEIGSLPQSPLLVWWGPDRSPRQIIIGSELVVGRQPGDRGLVLAEDKLLSRRHFSIRPDGNSLVLEDLDSHNGTSINRMRNRVQRHILRDGDLIFAGEQVFAFLHPGKSD